MNKMMTSLQKFLMPLGTTLANQRHLSAISRGLMASIPLTIIGAVAQIVANPPVTQDIIDNGGFLATVFGGWFRFAQANTELIMTPYNMTMGLFSVVVAFTIAYELAKSYKMNGLSSGIISMIMFVMVAAPIRSIEVADGSQMDAMNTGLLGSPGMFAAIAIALISVSLTRLCRKYKLVVRLPDVVPPSLADSFTAMIPLLVNVIVIYGINVASLGLTGASAPELFIGLLMAPLSAANSIPGILFLVTLAGLLWVMGVHGTMIVYPVIIPFVIEAITTNGELVAAGQSPVFSPVMLFGTLAVVGGSGNTLALVLLSLRSKSEQMKAIGKVSLIPGFFGINEPVTFGMPIMFNPILAIPYILSPLILSGLTLLAYSVGFIRPSYILILTLMPIGVSSFLGSMYIGNLIFDFLMIPVCMLIYYPFYKIYERQLLAQEQGAN